MSLLSPTPMRHRRERHTIANGARSADSVERRAIYARLFAPDDAHEARMVLDSESHWRWSNPAIYLPGLILLSFLVLGMLL
ncbi:MAG: hypothetical protein M3R24_22095 [Chloroflexota bacterium]|nr:hypothetical protein [Chloroflexota bacterium]PLS79043.1 MAG: hypothetical protein CYG59_15365 [Chloroflexota bacterium]